MRTQKASDAKTTFADDNAELRHLWHALGGLRRAVKDLPRFKAIHALSPIETGTLDVVAETPEVVMGDVGRALRLPKSTLTGVIDRLEAHGYLCRVPRPRDRRAFGLALTPRGYEAYRTHVRFETEVGRRMLAKLGSEAEKRSFLAALRRIVSDPERTARHA